MEYLSARIPLLASDLLARVITAGGANISHDDIMLWLHEYAQITKGKPVELAFVRPDYESIRQQLQSTLLTKDSWRDLIQAGVGETLLELIASIGAFSQLSVQRSLQESMLDSARLTSSVYNITRMLGVHINRKVPANVTVTLQGDGTYMQIPRYSQFEIEGIPFFNRQQITLTDRSMSVTTLLHQGQVQIDTLYSTGRPFQRFEIGFSDYNISDSDVLVVNDYFYEYSRAVDGLWHHEGEKYVFFENTTPNGNVELLFGNSLYGRMPKIDEQLNIIYCNTLGEEAHTTKTGLKVTLIELNDSVPEKIRGSNAEVERERIARSVVGVSASQIYGANNERTKEFYQALAPHIFAARGRAVTRKDYYAIAMQYPGIVDIYIQGQQELGPRNRAYMNLIGVTPLLKDGVEMSEELFKAFTEYMTDKAIWQNNFIHIPPNPVPLSIKAKVLCLPGTDLPKVKTYIEYRIAESFGLRRGSLGYSVYMNDIHAILKAQHHALQVDFAELTDPSIDIIVGNNEYVTIQSLSIDVGYSTRGYSSYVVRSP